MPDLTVTLLCDYDVQSERSDQVDVGILWHRPTNPDLIVARLATVHFMAFASRDYIAEMARPRRWMICSRTAMANSSTGSEILAPRPDGRDRAAAGFLP